MLTETPMKHSARVTEKKIFSHSIWTFLVRVSTQLASKCFKHLFIYHLFQAAIFIRTNLGKETLPKRFKAEFSEKVYS